MKASLEKKEPVMATVKVDNNNFKSEVMESDVPTVVDFWAEWCGPCKMIGPSLEELSDEMAGKVKIKVTGVVNKGDRLVSSAIPGVAQAVADDDATAFNVVARALQDKYNSNTETIMCVINRV